jgi:hypothetical protein
MLTLRDVPDPMNQSYWEGRFIIWPADDGEDFVRVRVGVKALADYTGLDLGVDAYKIRRGLMQNRDVIQQVARAKHRGNAEVTIDAGDYPARAA